MPDLQKQRTRRMFESIFKLINHEEMCDVQKRVSLCWLYHSLNPVTLKSKKKNKRETKEKQKRNKR
jgi:hypothetical protein